MHTRDAGSSVVTEPLVPQVPEPPEPAFEGPSDHELIRAAQQGKETAFQELVLRHEERAVRVALARRAATARCSRRPAA